MTKDDLTYRIDKTDTIISVSDNWGSYAGANAWRGSQHPEDVVGHKLWNFIKDIETRHLYKEVFNRVRRGKPCRAIPFRCDSSTERRYLELGAQAQSDGSIQITSTILRTETRSSVSLLDANMPRSTDMLTVCSMCKKIKVAQRKWAEIEEGLARLRLFEVENMPQLTHGLCPACYKSTMQKLELKLHEAKTTNKTINSDEE